MYKIQKSEKLADKIFLMDVEAPRIASHCEPGQFIIAKIDDRGERIPLTICDFDREKGLVTIVFQIVGASTTRMAGMKAGDAFRDFIGPLGRPSEFVGEDLAELKNKKIIFVAGGVGAAPVYPQVKWMKEHVFGQLLELSKRGNPIQEQNVDYAISLAMDDNDSGLLEIDEDCICHTINGKPIKPKTLGQKEYVDQIRNKMIVFGVGPAGTGKTYLAMAMAITAFRNGDVGRIILTRPAIEAGEKLGFLPGDLQSKIDPYLRPLYDALYQIMLEISSA